MGSTFWRAAPTCSTFYIIKHLPQVSQPGRCAGATSQAVFFLETIDAAARINEFLFAGEERMTVRANFHTQVLFDGTSLERIATGARYRRHVVFRMNSLLHFIHLFPPWTLDTRRLGGPELSCCPELSKHMKRLYHDAHVERNSHFPHCRMSQHRLRRFGWKPDFSPAWPFPARPAGPKIPDSFSFPPVSSGKLPYIHSCPACFCGVPIPFPTGP